MRSQGRRTGPQPVNRPFVFSANQARLLRLWQLNPQPHGLYRGEAMNGNNVLQILETGRFQAFYPANNGREGLFINACVPFVYLPGNTPGPSGWRPRV